MLTQNPHFDVFSYCRRAKGNLLGGTKCYLKVNDCYKECDSRPWNKNIKGVFVQCT